MPGSPPVSPVHGAPRYADSDAASFSAQVNGITDRFDITAMRLDTGLASARPGTGAGTGAWWYATDTRQLSRWSGSAWETNLPNAHAATHQDGGSDALTVREAMMATGANGLAKGSFSAYRNAAQTVANLAVVAFDTELFDVSGWHLNGVYTPQVAGYYRLSWLVSSQSITAGNWVFGQLAKNGTVVNNGTIGVQVSGSTQGPNSGGSAVVQANGTTDFFDIRAQQAGAANTVLNVGQATVWFSGHLIGRS